MACFLITMKFILGKKLKMSQVFDKHGNVIPVTEIQAGPCVVVQVKTDNQDKYDAVQIGFGKKEKHRLSKPLLGHMKDLGQFRWLREFRLNGVQGLPCKKKMQTKVCTPSFKKGDKILNDIFKPGEKVKITGISKGKGFQGVVKRWGFKGAASATHGTRHTHRTAGSIGDTGRRRVIKGKKMPGRMGRDTKTISNLKVVEVDAKKNILKIKGSVPGIPGGLLKIIVE